MPKYFGFTNIKPKIIEITKLPTELSYDVPEMERCSHGNPAPLCDMCEKMRIVAELKPHLDEYAAALERRRSKKKFPIIVSIQEADVCPQYTDFKVPVDFQIKQEALVERYWIADITIKRNIKLSRGVSMLRGHKGSLLSSDCVKAALNCVHGDSLKNNYTEIVEYSQKLGNQWVFVNGFLACLHQIEVIEKFSRKENKNIVTEKLNYKITSKEPCLFR